MSTEMPEGQARPRSGNEAPLGSAIPPQAESSPDTGTGRGVPALSLPGLPFSVDPKRVLWYGGLAALATVGVLEWPVAAVVGAGTYVAERLAREDTRRAAERRS